MPDSNNDWEGVVAVCVVLTIVSLVIGGIALTVYDEIFIEPYRADDAMNQCKEKGYDNYISYKGFFRTKAYGVKCDYVGYTKKDVDVVSDSNVEGSNDKVVVVT